jgi:hypothetical protein
MQAHRGIIFLLLPFFLMVMFSEVRAQTSSGPQPEIQKPTVTPTIPNFDVPKVRYTLTGKLVKEMAIGGETTGWAVYLETPQQIQGQTHIGVEPAGHNLAPFKNSRVQISGILENRLGPERKVYWVIVVEKIRPYNQ